MLYPPPGGRREQVCAAAGRDAIALDNEGMRVAVIDSGVHSAHPHINSVAGGISFVGPPGDFVDRVGHGTAVMAAIQEKAPAADYFAVRVFDRRLQTNIEALLSALHWCVEEGMEVVNLSLGTQNPAHRERFERVLEGASIVVVSAADPWLPGSLPDVIGVDLDPDCPRDEYRVQADRFLASPYARPIAGVPLEANLNGISFAVANFTGLLVANPESILTTWSAMSARATR